MNFFSNHVTLVAGLNKEMGEKDITRLKKLFAANLRRIRVEKGLSLLGAEYVSDLNESNISKYENGKREPQLSTIFKLARSLGVHPKELFDFDIELRNKEEKSNL